MLTKLFQPAVTEEVANKFAPQVPVVQASGWGEMTQQEINAETNKALDEVQKMHFTWIGIALIIICL